MKTFTVFSLSLVLLGGILAVPGPAQRPRRPDAVHEVMVSKLKSAQAILEGLAMRDFAKISRSADKLVQLTNTEEWFVLKTPRYEVQSNEFRRTVEDIAQKARDKNLDGAALAYFDMTRSCIRCHEYVREVRDVRLDLPPAEGLGGVARGGR